MVNSEQVLNAPMPPNDAGASTVRGYLVELLWKLWQEEEGFSAKRPFGNSGWQFDVYEALARAQVIPARFDRDGEELLDFDRHEADEIIKIAILSLHPDSSQGT
jgi:hypothetical protein